MEEDNTISRKIEINDSIPRYSVSRQETTIHRACCHISPRFLNSREAEGEGGAESPKDSQSDDEVLSSVGPAYPWGFRQGGLLPSLRRREGDPWGDRLVVAGAEAF